MKKEFSLSGQKEPAFVSSASVAAQLDVILKVAREMSISVKNAKAIANRAGVKARGFSPITDFINEMSLETMRIVSLINKESVELSQVAIEDIRAREAAYHFEKAMKLAEGSPYLSMFNVKINEVELRKKQKHDELIQYGRILKDLMEEITKHMTVANVIVSNSRIEAVNADEFRTNLEDIANDIETACDVIRKRVHDSQVRLENALLEWKRQVYDESSYYL